jgi:peptidoglycan/xylan/chitin deacetylase (PgdA/CDA1 family)
MVENEQMMRNAQPAADSRALGDLVYLPRRPLHAARRSVANMKWSAGRVSQRLLRRPIILAYHRVATVARDPLLLAVRPEHFAQQLEVLARIGRVIPLSGLPDAISERGGARGAAVITFDDGYLDNLTEARPELERMSAPATVFVTSGSPGGRFWWDELERLVLAPDTLPATFRLELGGKAHDWVLEDDRRADSSDGWTIRSPMDSPRQKLFRELASLIRPLAPELRDAALGQVALWSTEAPPSPLDVRSLTADEISRLGADGLVEIGAHSISHPVLAHLPADRQRVEIEESRRFVRDVTGRTPSTFAYPFGGRADFGPETVEILRGEKFSCAVTTIPGTIRRNADPLAFPRFLVRDWDGDEFERRFRGLLYG